MVEKEEIKEKLENPGKMKRNLEERIKEERIKEEKQKQIPSVSKAVKAMQHQGKVLHTQLRPKTEQLPMVEKAKDEMIKAKMFNPLEFIFKKIVAPKQMLGKLIGPKQAEMGNIKNKKETMACYVDKEFGAVRSDSSQEDLCFVDLQEATGSKK